MLQILNVIQTATMLVIIDPEKAILEDLVDWLAVENGFPTSQEIVVGAPEGLTSAKWDHFWRYTEAIHPYKTVNTHYLPLRTYKQSTKSMQLSLY